MLGPPAPDNPAGDRHKSKRKRLRAGEAVDVADQHIAFGRHSPRAGLRHLATWLLAGRLHPAVHKAAKLEHGRTESPHMNQERPFIAVVDDDESVRAALPELIKDFGYEAVVFASAEEFLLSNLVSRVDCLIVDITMPGMSGIELQQELQRLYGGVPVVFITAYGNEDLQKRLQKLGAAACLLKPFSDLELQSAIVAALKKP